MSIRGRDSEIVRFLDKYTEKTKTYGLGENTLRRHVIHLENDIKGHPHRLASHSPVGVEKYLNAKGRNTGLKGWQFEQLVDALSPVCGSVGFCPYFSFWINQPGRSGTSSARETALPGWLTTIARHQ